MTQSWQSQYLDRFYRSRDGWVDGTTQFHSLCTDFIPPGARILEVGAGPDNPTSRFLASLGELHGVDPDPDVTGNPSLKTVRVMTSDRIDYPDEHFDACVSNYVAEHVANPEAHLREVRRVLRQGGVYLLRTPNLFHYVSVVSRFTPHWVHLAIANPLRGRSKADHDPYPTVYAMNTPRSLTALAGRFGMKVERLDLVEKEPSYGMMARPLFFAFMLYERAVNASDLVAPLRANIFAALRKTGHKAVS